MLRNTYMIQSRAYNCFFTYCFFVFLDFLTKEITAIKAKLETTAPIIAVCNNLGLLCGPRNLQNIITPIMREMDRSSDNLQKDCDQATLH